MAGRRAPHLRARDADRDAVCRVLDAALAEGQLTGTEHRDRVAAATTAATLGELQHLTTDLQDATSPDVVRTGAGVNRRLLLLAAAGVGAIAVVIAVVAALSGSDAPPTPSAPTAKPVAETPPPRVPSSDEVPPSVVTMPTEFHTEAGMTGLLETVRQRFGDTTGIELAIWRDEAMLLRPHPTDAQTKQLYRFDNGWGRPSDRERDPEDGAADLAAFNVAAAVEALRTAPETLRIAPADVSEVVLDIDPVGDGPLELLIKVSNTSGDSGFVHLDGSGAVTHVEYPT